MKPFAVLKIAMPLLGLGALLLLAPQSRAQSEVAPDHFDGTDSWATAPAKAPAAKTVALKTAKPGAVAALQTQNKKPGTQATPQLTPAKNVSAVPHPEPNAVQRKRQTAPAQPNKQ